jgi:RNA polymerase sigma factor (TIGR02999 family)
MTSTHRTAARSASPAGGEVTRLLGAVRDGEHGALDRLLPLLYDDLRDLARAQLAREREPRTLRATALVHEAYVKLAAGPGDRLRPEDRTHFFAIAARAMRQVLVDQARRRRSAKRGGNWVPTTLADGHASVELQADELLALDDAMKELDARQLQVVELRFFGGLEEEEIASMLDVSARTVRRDWVKARARLYRRLYPSAPPGEREPKQSGADPR